MVNKRSTKEKQKQRMRARRDSTATSCTDQETASIRTQSGTSIANDDINTSFGISSLQLGKRTATTPQGPPAKTLRSASGISVASNESRSRGRPSKNRRGAGRQTNEQRDQIEEENRRHVEARVAEAEAEEQQQEADAEAINDVAFIPPVLQPRRSTRNSKAPVRYSDSGNATDEWNKPIEEVTTGCKRKHKGFGCASATANHYPEYYDSAKENLICKFQTCKARLMSHETDSMKCCAAGKVQLLDILANLQKPDPRELMQLKEERFNANDTKNFLKYTWQYNSELAFGTLVMDKENVPYGHPVVKINGAIKYRLSDLFYPGQHAPNPNNYDFARKWGQCYTITPQEAIAEREQNLEDNRLKPHILAELHTMLARDHNLAQAYKHAADFYAERKRAMDALGCDMPNFRMTLMSKRKAVEEGADIPAGIHDHRLLLPTEQGLAQCGTVHFIEAGDAAPPAEKGIVLYGRDGRFVDFLHFDPNIDPAMFPLLFPYGQRTYEHGIPLATTEEQQQEQQDEPEAMDVDDEENDDQPQQQPMDNEEETPDGETTDCTNNKWIKKKGAHQFVSQRQFYRYMMQIRDNAWQPTIHWLWWAAWMAQIFILTVFNRIEANEADAIKRAQANLITILPTVLIAAIQNKINNGNYGFGTALKLGKIFFAPATFRGSRRYYQKAYADAQALCRAFGHPHIFLTFTINSECDEFKRMIPNKQDRNSKDKAEQFWADRPDIVARVFINKQKELMKDIVKQELFGAVAGWYSSVEHQKRGLAHLHLCVILQTKDNNYFKLPNWRPMTKTPEQWCKEYISAEIPTLPPKNATGKKAKRQRDYHETVVNLMAHRCSPACVIDGKCTKRFPMSFSQCDVISEDSYPQYRRRPPAATPEEKKANPDAFGETHIFKPARNCGVSRTIDNRHIVAHNRFLLMKYKSHINVEWCQGDATAKYVTKYITKGCDLAIVKVQSVNNDNTVNYDEFEEIRTGVYRTSCEAALGIIGHKIFDKSHTVQSVFVHQPGNIQVVYEDGEEEATAEQEEARILRGEERRSQLTEYFKLNAKLKRNNQADIADKYNYSTISQAYSWNKGTKTWIERQHKRHTIVRVGSASAGNRELQAIRLLLLTTFGPTSFKDLQTHEGQEYPTFIDAAIARGLMTDDSMWELTVRDAMAEMRSLSERIRWFALFIANVLPMKPAELLEKNFTILTTWPGLSQDAKRQKLLARIEVILRIHGIRPTDTAQSACEAIGLPRPGNYTFSQDDDFESAYFRQEFLDRQMADEADDQGTGPRNTYAATFQRSFNQCTDQEQKPFVNDVITAAKADPLDSSIQRLFFLTGEGGTGKTFTYNTIIAGLKAARQKVLACATTGIAAELLIDGATVHRTFGIPNELEGDTESNLVRHSRFAQVLDAAQVIIVDEVSMQDRYVLEYMDRALRSICQKEVAHLPFAGKTIVLGGDWKQLLPVIPGGSSEVQFCRSVKSSVLFQGFKTVKLTINQRMSTADQATKDYARYLKKLATGVINNNSDNIKLPSQLLRTNEQEVIDYVFPPSAFADPLKRENLDKIKGSAILCPTNEEAFRINQLLSDKIRGQERTFYSIDEVVNEHALDCMTVNAADRCTEHLNRETPSGLPPHRLPIKVGAIMMIIKNLSVLDGLCNGTRVQIIEIIGNNLLKCRYINGPRANAANGADEFLLHKHPFEHGGGTNGTGGEAAFKWQRLQFPLRPGFVMTVNKAQGQTLDRLGLMLQKSSCFSHGQLYVAMSRVRTPQSIQILLGLDKYNTRNIVYQPAIDKDEVEAAYQLALQDDDLPADPAPVQLPPPIQPMPASPAQQPTTSRAANVDGFFGRPDALQWTPTTQDVGADGNCFFRAFSSGLHGHQGNHLALRRHAAMQLQTLDQPSNNNRQDIEDAIAGVLEGGMDEFERTCSKQIRRYAVQYTAQPGIFAGVPEAIALAEAMERTVIIVTAETATARQEREARGQQQQREMAIVYRPNMERDVHWILRRQYQQLWHLENNPIVLYHNGGVHYMSICCQRT